MQRGPYSNMGPAQSPPLHHPVPQHVSTVPQLRSPPPPMTQRQQQQQAQQQQYGYAPNNYGQPPFGGFINDPTAQMGFQMGKTAVAAGQEYMEQNFNRYVNVSAMKHYFNVSNKYVVNKLFIVLFPWRHRPWSRQQQPMATGGQSGPMFLPPREDINSPDMYIPVMAFVTYILLSTLLAGLQGAFRPELLGLTATNAFAVVIIELLLLKLGTYLLNISNESQWLDLVAYSGYKFVGIIVTIALAALTTGGKGTGGYIGWSVFAYTYMANAFFLLRSLKYVILPDTASGAHNPIARSHKSRRTQFLFIYSYIIQLAFMWWLSSL